MKAVWAAFLAFLIAASTSQATHTIAHGFVVLDAAHGGNVFFDTDLPTINPDFTNTVATISQGQSILLGGEVETTRGSVNSQETAADVAAIQYSFDNVTFTSLNLPKIINGNPDRWQQASAGLMVEIGSSLPVGVHTLYIRFSATDNNHPVAPGLTTFLPSSGSYSAQIQVVPQTPTPDGSDEASAPEYINNGWGTGQGEFGTTFGAWTLTTTSGSLFDNGFFVGSSTNNAGGGGPGIDSIFDPGPARRSDDERRVGHVCQQQQHRRSVPALCRLARSGQEFELEMDNGNIDTGGYVGFVLRNGNVTTNKNAGQRFEFLFAGGESTYKYIDENGVHDTGIGFTGGGLSVRFILTSPDTYALRVIALGNLTPFNFSGMLSGSAGLSIESMALYNQNAGSGSSKDVFFNKLLVTTGTVPEPRIMSISIQGGTNALIDCRGIPGATHELQARDDLNAGSWTTLTNNISTVTGILQLSDSFASSQQRRFYQLKVTY